MAGGGQSDRGAFRWHRRRHVAPLVVAAAMTTAIVVLLPGRGEGWATYAPGPGTELVSDEDTVCGTDHDNHLFCLEGATGDELFSTEVTGLRTGLLSYSLDATLSHAAATVAADAVGDAVVTNEYLVTVDACCIQPEHIEGRPHDD